MPKNENSVSDSLKNIMVFIRGNWVPWTFWCGIFLTAWNLVGYKKVIEAIDTRIKDQTRPTRSLVDSLYFMVVENGKKLDRTLTTQDKEEVAKEMDEIKRIYKYKDTYGGTK